MGETQVNQKRVQARERAKKVEAARDAATHAHCSALESELAACRERLTAAEGLLRQVQTAYAATEAEDWDECKWEALHLPTDSIAAFLAP